MDCQRGSVRNMCHSGTLSHGMSQSWDILMVWIWQYAVSVFSSWHCHNVSYLIAAESQLDDFIHSVWTCFTAVELSWHFQACFQSYRPSCMKWLSCLTWSYCVLQILCCIVFNITPPLIGGGIKRCFCLMYDVCLSRTSGISREQRGPGRPNWHRDRPRHTWLEHHFQGQ